ncbi:response regulator transcription factor [Enterococcus sp.]|uniref:response regulator transcription factor n=1 Tax=Enterococcus sp. TaxID=35783 RepID=UPI002FC58D1C
MNLLLIDDEPLLIKSLLLIDWVEQGFNNIFTADKASTALHIIQNNDIDLLISDIQMPGLTGLDLYEQVLIHYPHILCIYLSGYEKFSYATKAVKLQAVDFLTKPVRDNDLLTSVARAKKIIRERNTSSDELFTERKIMNRFLNGNSSENELLKIPFFQTISIDEPVLQLIAIKYEKTDISLENMIRSVTQLIERSTSKYIDAYFIFNEHNCLYFIIKKKHSVTNTLWNLCLTNIQLIIHQTLFLFVQIYHSEDLFCASKILEFLNNMRDDIYNLPLAIDSIIELHKKKEFSQSSNHTSLRELYTSPSFQSLFELENFNEIFQKLDRIEFEVLDTGSDSHALQDELLFTFVNSFSYLINVKNNILLKNTRDFLIRINNKRSYSSFEELISYLKMITKDLQEESKKENSLTLIDKINHLILKNSDTDMTVNWIAEVLNYHPAYLSKIYKEKTGTNLKDILFYEKMQYATRLLKNPDLKIYEISELVGFSNVSYFSAQFKNALGVTPLVYRNKTLNRSL